MNNTLKYLAVAAVAAAAIGGAIYLTSHKTSEPSPSPTVSVSSRPCTMEAKVCPDGTAVGRVGPNCEFAACPTPIRTTLPQPGSGY